MIAQLDADLMVVAAYGLILPKAVLQLPRLGCINIHASLLPRWRGAAPIPRAILAGDTESGITIMQMDEGLDTGDMLLQRSCMIAENDTAQTLHDKLAAIGADCIVKALQQLPHLTPLRQDNEAANYAAKLQKTEAKIDWRLDAQQIERAVRAFNPYPVCHTGFNELTLKVWQAALQPGVQGEPGSVVAADKHGITVACGKDGLLLQVLQRPGGKVQPGAQLLQALPIKPGDQFD
jgi:methionyl-tRNA formyltransferase